MNYYVSELLDSLLVAAKLAIVVCGFVGACILMVWIGERVFA